MPEPNNDNGGKNIDALLRMLQEDRRGADLKAAEGFRYEVYRRPELRIPQGNCIRCHQQPEPLKLDFRPLAGFDAPLGARRVADRAPETPEEIEKRVVDKFAKQPIIDKAVTIMNRLPDKIDIDIQKDKMSITTDFVKALEAIPGVKLDKEARDYLSKVKAIEFADGRYGIKLDKAIDLKIGTLAKEVSFDVKNDTSKPDGVGLTGIKGLSILGADVTELTVNTEGGKNAVNVTGQLFGRKISHEIDLSKYGANGELLKKAIGQLAEYKPMFQKRDFGKFTNDIPEGFRTTVQDLLSGVSKISKDGDTYTIKRNNGVAKFDFGGPQISVSPEVKFKLGKNADAPSLTDVSGITFSMPLPEKLQLGEKYITNIKGVSLGYAENDGGRSVRVDIDNQIDSVRVRLGSDFKPRTDGDGNWNLNVRGSNPLSERKGDKMDINLRMGKSGNINMKASEILDIVSNLTWQASDFSVTGVSMGAAATYSKVASWISSLFE